MTTEQPTQKLERKVLGVTLGDVMKVILGAVVVLIVQWWTAKSPYLRITSTESMTFPGAKNQFGLVGASVTNDGSKEAEDVECSFVLPDSDIVEVAVVSDSGSATAKTEGKHKVRAAIGMLNSGESFKVSAMATNPDKLPEKLEPKVRGKGVVGTTLRRSDQPSVIVGISIIVALAYALFFFVTYRFLRSRLKRLPPEARQRLRANRDLFRWMLFPWVQLKEQRQSGPNDADQSGK